MLVNGLVCVVCGVCVFIEASSVMNEYFDMAIPFNLFEYYSGYLKYGWLVLSHTNTCIRKMSFHI